jgi:hypothetical protein
MELRKIMITALMTLTVGVMAQEEKRLESYHYFEAQGGAQITATNDDMSKLLSPTVALSYGYMTPSAGGRLHINGWQSKSTADYKFKYIDVNADILLNVTNIFSRNTSRLLNLYLLGGMGLVSTFDREARPEGVKHDLVHNLRAGLRLETNITKPLGISLEFNANNMSDHFNGKLNNSDDWGFTAMLGVSYRFGHKYKTISKPAPILQEKLTHYQMMTNRLNEELGLWNKQMPNESLEAYQLRVNDQTRAVQARNLEYNISTQMATELLPTTQITFGDYNPGLKKLAVHATSMPDFYLDMDAKEAASLYGTNNVQLRNPKYTLHPDDSFELVYAEVYNPATGKTYTFDNLSKMSLNELRNDGGYLPLSVVKETHMKETRLAAIKDDMVNLAKNDKVITDHTHITVNSNAMPTKDATGHSIINYNVGITYEVEEKFSARDDFKPGRYVTTESKAAVLMLQIMKKAFDQDFSKYLKAGKQVVVKIKGTADASPINRPIVYNGQYGEYNGQTVYKNGQPMKLSLTREEGIATNEQLAFARALGVKNWIENEVTAINKMKRDYEYQIEVSSEKGSKYRRISVEYTFVDAF